MSINPFDNDDGSSFVLVNDEEQHSCGRPRRCSSQQAGRAACLDYIEQNWTDIRPKSLRQRLAEDAG